jgi:hypothetical protein
MTASGYHYEYSNQVTQPFDKNGEMLIILVYPIGVSREGGAEEW